MINCSYIMRHTGSLPNRNVIFYYYYYYIMFLNFARRNTMIMITIIVCVS